MIRMLNRRTFLNNLIASSASLTLAPRTLARDLTVAPAQRSQKVIVVGAGIAGLVAAYELMKGGYDVVVLEARMRTGGRIHTLRDAFADGLYVEAGAVDFSANYTLLQRYLSALDLPTVVHPQAPKSVLYLSGKRYLVPPEPEFGSSDAGHTLSPQDAWRKYVIEEAQQTGDPLRPVWSDARARELDGGTLNDLFRRHGISTQAIKLFASRLDGSDFDHVSALETINFHHFYSGWTDTMSVKGGNDLLPKAFAEKLGRRIVLGAQVQKIAQNNSSVRVSFLRAGQQNQMEADHVIVTVPFSVLRHVALDSSISATKQEAINKLEYEPLMRVYLQSRTRFWSEQGISGSADSDLPIGSLQDHTCMQPGVRGILEAQMPFHKAGTSSKLSEVDRLFWTLGHVEKIHPGMAENFEGGISYTWDNDPWALGAWSYYRPGQMTRIFPHVAEPEGRIHFAGEHTSTLPATIEGAIYSGVRAASEISRT